MDIFIGLLEIAAWIIVVVSIAAGLTLFMIKVMPQRGDDEEETTEEPADS
ncbi:MAG: hypothetical protein ACR2OD_02445 [Gaiellaceae bacterium]